MSVEFSMIGSGIYSECVIREIICADRCYDCEHEGKVCDNIWEDDLYTDDRGNIDNNVKCDKCGHTMNYREDHE